MAFYSYLSTKIIIAFITKSYQDLFGVRSYINALFKLVIYSSACYGEVYGINSEVIRKRGRSRYEILTRNFITL